MKFPATLWMSILLIAFLPLRVALPAVAALVVFHAAKRDQNPA